MLIFPSKPMLRWLTLVVAVAANILTAPFGFMVYSLIRNSQGKPLVSSESFTALSVFLILATATSVLIYAIPAVLSGVACFGRIQQFLELEEVSKFSLPVTAAPSSESSSYEIELKRNYAIHHSPQGRRGSGQAITSDLAIHAQDAALCWARSDASGIEGKTDHFKSDEKANTDDDVGDDTGPDVRVLCDINVSIPRMSICGVVGPVGCGKTSLLNAFAGELKLASGQLQVQGDGIALCTQTVWLKDSSVKSNILNGLPYSEHLFQRVLHACALEEMGVDLHDMRASALSGGQKQRVVSCRSSVSLLDTCCNELSDDRRAWPERCMRKRLL